MWTAGERLDPTTTATGAGRVLSLIRSGEGVTRADIARRTGLARSTVAQRVEALLAHRLVIEAGGSASTGGRPPTMLAFNRAAGVVLVADIGATHSRLAVSDLGGAPLSERAYDTDVARAPELVLGWVHERFQMLLDEAGRRDEDVRGIGIGVPAPVAFSRGEPVAPPMMPGWDGFSIPGWFSRYYDAPVLVDNDVNIMALGEHWSHWRETEHMLYVKIGTGIGCGIVSGRKIHRGAQGAAGDIGHVRLAGHDDVVCRCGNNGCLEAVAGGRALASQLRAAGLAAATSRDVVRLVQAGEPPAIQSVRDAGRHLGEVLAECINFFNPGVIVIGGDISEAHQQLLAGVREVAFGRSLPMATRDLRMSSSQLGDRAGVIGAAIMVIEHVLSPESVDRAIQAQMRTPRRPPAREHAPAASQPTR